MPAEAKPTVTPPPVFARRNPKPQYLSPGQHLKIASRKPPSKKASAGPQIPRDPWESQDEATSAACYGDEDSDIGCLHKNGIINIGSTPEVRVPKAPSPALAFNSMMASGGNSFSGRSQRAQRYSGKGSAGGHPFSSHLSRSRSSANSEPSSPLDASNFSNNSTEDKDNRAFLPGSAEAQTATLTREYTDASNDSKDAATFETVTKEVIVAEEGIGDNYYYDSTEGPGLTATERAQRVLEMQQQALEAKHVEKLAEQGIARRPKTLVRNRHGRLQAITAKPFSPSAANSADATQLVADAPVTMKPRLRPVAQGVRSSEMSTSAPAKAKTSGCATGGGDLVDSRASTPRSEDDNS